MFNGENFRVIVVGAGASGLAAANALVTKGVKPENIIILEKNKRVGGKLKTHRETGIDMGGVVFSMLNPVVKHVKKHNIPVENVLPIEEKCLNQMNYGSVTPSYWTVFKSTA